MSVRRLGGTMLAALVCALLSVPMASAEPNGRQVPLPPGLASVWRVDGRQLDSRAAAWSAVAFSTDGKLVGVSDDGGTRIYGVDDGRLVRAFPAPFATGQFAFSLAMSATHVAVGRVGGVEVYALDASGEPLKFHCAGLCGPVSSVAFAPNGTWLAYQSTGGSVDSRGLVTVVDVRQRARVAQLEASATRAGVMFAAGGRALVAANSTRVDDTGTFGVRRFSVTDGWRRTRDVPGAQVPRGSIGPYAFDERVAAYAREGVIELRDVATGALLWHQPFVPQGLDAGPVDVATKLELVALSPRGDLMLSYESPVSGDALSALVLRRVEDGQVVAMYDAAGISALAFAPDGASFVYTTGVGRTYTVLAKVPD